MTQKLRLLNLLGLSACFVVGASAQQVGLQMTAVNPQSYAVYGNGGGAYTNPYTFSVTPGGGGILLSCDDFMDDVFTGESWTANVTYLQTDILGEANPNQTVMFSQSSVQDQENKYSEVAYLAAALMQWANSPNLTGPNGMNGFGNQTAAVYSFAIWSIFDPTGVANFLNVQGGVTDGSQVLTNFASDVNADVADAISFVNTPGTTVANETIYTPVPGSQTGPTPPQEFIQVTGANQFASTPEPSSVAGLLIDLFGAFGLVVLLHRRLALTK